MTKKKLDLALVEQSSKELSKKREVDIPVEIEGKTQIAVLEIDEVFQPSKVRKCIEEFISRMDTIRKNNPSHLHEIMEAYFVFLTIKHFTSFPAPREYVNQVRIINMLVDTGLLYKIYANFKEKEISKLIQEISDAVDKMDEFTEPYIELAKQMGFDKVDEEK